ncbi:MULTISPECIES: alpha/beta fold hydrolase [unclassified Sphingomonas]|uniref:alpha/beta fold hydrolase n=1 Tax=Novosphingobium rhizosphaerae TaxID=1551649 RepID=UPI0015CBD675
MTLAYNKEGSGDRTVLCITGLNGHAGFWTNFRKALSETCTVISFDQRGCGDNRAVAGEHTLAEIVSDTVAVLDDAGVESAIVVGHSMGGVITQFLALDHPERVRAAVFSGTFCVFDWYMQNTNNLRMALLNKVGTEDCARFSAMLAMPGGNVMDERYDLHSRITKVSSKAPDDVVMGRMRAPYGFDRRAELPRITAPSLVIGASDDLLAPLYQSQLIADAIPDARLEVMDGGHFFPNTRPETYLEKVVPFIMSQPVD